MKILLVAVALVGLVFVACNNCTPGPHDEPVHCAPLPDAGSADCQAGQTCAPIIGGPDAGPDNRCFDRCHSGACASGYSCQPTAVGNCNAQYGGDGGSCETRFLCMPTYCGG